MATIRVEMYRYRFSACNPEGIDWTIYLKHYKKYHPDDFYKICDEVLFEFYSTEYSGGELGHFLVSSGEKIFDLFKKRGFEPDAESVQACFSFDPYWGESSVSEKTIAAKKAAEEKDKEIKSAEREKRKKERMKNGNK